MRFLGLKEQCDGVEAQIVPHVVQVTVLSDVKIQLDHWLKQESLANAKVARDSLAPFARQKRILT